MKINQPLAFLPAAEKFWRKSSAVFCRSIPFVFAGALSAANNWLQKIDTYALFSGLNTLAAFRQFFLECFFR